MTLQKWIKAGPNYSTRLEHQAARRRPQNKKTRGATQHGSSSDSSSSDSDSSSNTISSRSSGGEQDQTQVQVWQEGESLAVVEPLPSVAHVSCWVCGAKHAQEECPYWMLAVQDNKKCNLDNIRQVGELMVGRGCILTEGVRTQDVLGDGNCLFTAFVWEVSAAYKGRGQSHGSSWRAYLLDYIRNSTDMIDGVPIKQWLKLCQDKSVDEYCRTMAAPGGRATWGGFSEVSMLCTAWGQGLRCVMLEERVGGFQVLAFAGASPTDASSKPICLAWIGNHWVRARMVKAAHAKVNAWILQR